MNKKNKQETEEFINPIDPDKITATPHSLPYAHTRGSVEVKPIDKGRAKGRAVKAMYEQTDMQLEQIRRQIELLARQARAIQDRVQLSEEIYLAEMNFEPLMGNIYHLYRRREGKALLSLVGPREWGSKPPYQFVATARLLSDHTWEILEQSTEEE